MPDYSRSVTERLAAAGLRVELDERQEKIGYKIRSAQLQKVPYMLVVGDREAAESSVSVRHRTEGDLGSRNIEDFIDAAMREIREKRSAVGPTLRSGVVEEATRLGGSYRIRPRPASG